MSEPKIKNMEEFASVSGLSRPTVSKYFNDPSSVRRSTRERIEAALERYEYRPNIYAVNQNRRLTKNVGVVVPYLSDPFFAEIARNIENLVSDAGYRPILLSSQGDTATERANLDSLRSIKPAGVLIAPLGRTSDRTALDDFCQDVPTVLFDSNIEGVGDAFFGHNNETSTRQIVDYLVKTGEAPIFFEMRTPPNPNANKRRLTYISAMERLGHKPHFIQVEGEGWNFEEIGFHEGSRLLKRNDLPTNTILCSNDRLAIGLLSAAYQENIRVGAMPDADIRIAGHDDHPFARYTSPTLTTVSQDYTSIARKSVEALFGIVESQTRTDIRQMSLFDGRLITRGSA